MSTILEKATNRLSYDDTVTVVLWDKSERSGRRTTMKYGSAKTMAMQNGPRSSLEVRIIVLPAH